MPWRPLPRIAFAIAIYPFQPSTPADLPLELGDELYIIEEGGIDGAWFRGYLVAPPSLLAGLTSVKGQTLEARVFSGIFPRNCVEVREVLGETGHGSPDQDEGEQVNGQSQVKDQDSAGSPASAANGSLQNGTPTKQRVANGIKVSQPLAIQTSGDLGISEQEWPNDQAAKTSRRSPSSQKSLGPNLPLTPVSMSPKHLAVSRPPAPVPMLKIGDETPTSRSEPLVDEIASCLREWHSTNIHELLLSRRYTVLEELAKLVNQLDLARRQLLHGILTNRELELLREITVWDLVKGNKMLSNEIIVRDPKQRGRLLTGEDTAIEISKLQSSMSLLEKPPVPFSDHVKMHHVMVELKGISNTSRESPVLFIYLCLKVPGEPPKTLTESFSIELPRPEQFNKALLEGKMRTLFTDLTPGDIGEATGADAQLYVVIKVQANQLTKPASLISSRPTVAKETSSTWRETVGGDSTGTTSKAGRRSLMWGSSKAATSPRQRGQSGSKGNDSMSGKESTEGLDESEPRPPTAPRVPNQEAPQYVKKSIGVAVLPLIPLLFQNEDVEKTVAVWAPSTVDPQADDDGAWDKLVGELMNAPGGGFDKCKSLNRIRLRLHYFASADAEKLIKMTPTLLYNIPKTSKIGFSGAPKKPRSDIYITLSEPVLPSQALFSHPERGPTSLGTNLDMRNIQLTLEVRKGSGERIEHCIFPSSNSAGHTAWRSTAIGRGEAWNQTIRLAIPNEDVPNAHLIMSIADAPGFPFALCWMPLWDQDAFIQDSDHRPLLYLYDKLTSNTEMGRGAYLNFPWNSSPAERSQHLDITNGALATLSLKSYLCSTAFSQDQVLLAILQWRNQPETQLLSLLRQLVFVPEIEIVKLVSDVFDALFGILVDRSGSDEYEDLVFSSLVTVLGIVHDRRFNLGPVVDQYIEERFSYPFATPCLIRSYLRILARPTDYQNSRQLRATFKVGRQVMKFIITARTQQRVKEAGIGITNTQPNFNRDFTKIFEAFETLMREQSAFLIGSKTLIVQHMHTWLPELIHCFAPEEVLHIAARFVDACDEVQGKLILHKLVLILNLSKHAKLPGGPIQERLNFKIAEWIAPYWGETEIVNEQYREQVRLCASIVAHHGITTGSQAPGYSMKIVQSYRCIQAAETPKADSLTLLFPSTYPFLSKPVSNRTIFNENLIELAALMTEFSTYVFLKQGNAEMDNAESLIVTMECSKSILSGEAFPRSWLTLHVYHHRAILNMLESIFTVLNERYLPSPDDADDFRTELWKTFLETLLKLVRSDALALETFPEQKRRAVWKIAGDVREQGAALLGRSWDAIGWETSPEEQKLYGLNRLGGYQVQYVPSLVAPIVELCMSVHVGLRSVAVEILQSMIVSEWILNEDLAVIQAEMVSCLDTLFKSKDMTEIAQQKIFISDLMDLFEPLAETENNPLWEAIKALVSTVDELLDLLVAVHNLESTEASRIMNTLRLMDFLKGMQKQDIFVRYVHQLVEVQAKARNYTEAGLALQLHADLYSWDPATSVEELIEPSFPKQSSFERKEGLFFEMIKYFEEGSAWDCALASYQELGQQYDHKIFDFSKLARTQRSMARIQETIARGDGHSPRYYKVAYLGLGFPTNLRDKQFIYQGNRPERLAAFTDRLQQKHPAAQIVGGGEIENVEGQFLQVSAVSPHRALDHPLYQLSKVPQSTREFILTSRPQQFSVTSKRHSANTNIKDQWIEKTVYTTVEAFPTILRRSEITSVDVVSLSPLQTAVERITRKTSELAILGMRIRDGDKSNIPSMTEAIKSSVDPASTTSVSLYRELLPRLAVQDDDNDASPQALQPLENALKTALLDFASTLRHSLMLHARFTPSATHHDLFTQFLHSFAPELTQLTGPHSSEPSQTIEPWIPTPSFNPPLPFRASLLPNETNSSDPGTYDFVTTSSGQHTSSEATATSRKRLSAFIKRAAGVESQQPHAQLQPLHTTQHHTNDISATSLVPPGTATSISKSHSSGRPNSPSREKRRSRLSWRGSEDGQRREEAVRERASQSRLGKDSSSSRTLAQQDETQRPVTGGEARPITAHSAQTAGTGASVGKKGSLRKRLSNFGIGGKSGAGKNGGGKAMGRKESRVTLGGLREGDE